MRLTAVTAYPSCDEHVGGAAYGRQNQSGGNRCEPVQDPNGLIADRTSDVWYRIADNGPYFRYRWQYGTGPDGELVALSANTATKPSARKSPTSPSPGARKSTDGTTNMNDTSTGPPTSWTKHAPVLGRLLMRWLAHRSSHLRIHQQCTRRHPVAELSRRSNAFGVSGRIPGSGPRRRFEGVQPVRVLESIGDRAGSRAGPGAAPPGSMV